MTRVERERILQRIRSSSPPPGDDPVTRLRNALLLGAADQHIPTAVRIAPLDAPSPSAEWVLPPDPSAAGTIVYFHGGAYVAGELATARRQAADLAMATGRRVMSVAYRLAPDHPHPAGIDDAVSALRLAAGTDPAGTTVAIGMSSGGGIALSAALRLIAAGESPAALVLLAPWLDLTLSGDSAWTVDDAILDPDEMRHFASLYADDPRAASPLFADLGGLPPTLVQVGDQDLLVDDSVRFAERAAASGIEVELEVVPEFPHAWHELFADLEEAASSYRAIAAFIERMLA